MQPVLLEVLPTPMPYQLLATADTDGNTESGTNQPPRQRKKRVGTLQELLKVHPEFEEVWIDATEQEVPKPKAKTELPPL